MIKTIKLNYHTLAKYRQAMKIGLMGALLMIVYLVTIELLTGGNSYGWKFFKYFFLAIPMAFGLCKMSEGEGFQNPYLPQSTFYTAIIAATAAGIMIVAYWITLPVEGIDLATISATVVEQNQMNNANIMPLPIPFMLFLEVFAMGMIIGFALLVYGTDIKHISKRKSKEKTYKTTVKKVA